MRLEWIAIRSILGRKRRSFLLFCTITATVALVFTLYTLNQAASLAVADSFDKLGPNIIVVAKDSGVQPITADDTMKIMTIKDSDSIAAVSPKVVVVEDDQLLIGVHFHYETQLRPWWQWQGQLPFAKNDILIGKLLAERLQLSLNNSLILNGQTFNVSGILERMGTEEDHAIFMPLLTLQELYELGEEVTFIEVAALCTTCPLPEIIEQIKHKLPAAEVTAISEPLSLRTQTIERLQQFMVSASIVILLLGCLLTGVSIMNNVYQRNSEIAVLRACGLRLLHVIDILLTELLIIATVSGLAGYGLGLLIAQKITPLLVTLAVPVAVNLQLGLQTVLVTIVLTIGASAIPMLRACQVDPSKILRT